MGIQEKPRKERSQRKGKHHVPLPKFMKGLGPSLHIVQIASNEEMNAISIKIT